MRALQVNLPIVNVCLRITSNQELQSQGKPQRHAATLAKVYRLEVGVALGLGPGLQCSCPQSIPCSPLAFRGPVDGPGWQNKKLAFLSQAQTLPVCVLGSAYKMCFPQQVLFWTPTDLLGEATLFWSAWRF